LSTEARVLRTRVAERIPADTRIDTYIADVLKLCSRSQVKRRVLAVLVGGHPAKLSRHLRTGEELEIHYTDPPEVRVEPEPIPLEILYEDEAVVVVNKPQGMVVHPASGNWTGTLVNALLAHCSDLAERFPGEPARPGIVHRLDKDTSGVMIAAKNAEAKEYLGLQFRERKVGKQYLAVVRGRLPAAQGRVETLIRRDPHHRKRFVSSPNGGSGKRAITRYRTIALLPGCTLVSLRPKTGRTHQLRVHMASLGCPILGDSVYGRGSGAPSLMLHAYRLRLRLPGGKAPRTFRAPLPARFREMLRPAG
jgi:23S rRNA pseudouridine1911/1915/1917 synthase